MLESKVRQLESEGKRYREQETKNAKQIEALREACFEEKSKVATKAIVRKLNDNCKKSGFARWLAGMPTPASKRDILTNQLEQAKLKRICNQIYRIVHGYASGDNIAKGDTLRWWWAKVILKRRIRETHFLKRYDLKTQLQLSYYVEICNDIAKSYDKLDIVSLLKTIRISSERIAEAEHCSVFLVNRDGDLELASSDYEIVAALDSRTAGAGVVVSKRDSSILSHVASHSKTMIVEDVTKSPLYNPAIDRMRAGRVGHVRSIMTIPMFATVEADEEFIRSCFNRYDVDGSEMVDFSELKLVFGALEMDFNDDDIYNLLHLVGIPSDTPVIDVEVSYEQFRAMLSSSGKKEMVAVLHLVNKLEARGEKGKNWFDESDLDNMQVICRQAPMAIRTCLKCEEQNRMLDQFRAMNDMTKLSETDIDTAALTQSIVTLLHAERGTFYLKDRKRAELNYDSLDSEGNRRQMHIPCDLNSIPGSVVMEKQLINIAEAYNDPRFNKPADISICKPGSGMTPARSVLCVPVIAASDGEAIGCIEMFNRVDEFGVVRCFTREDEEALTAFGVCIENALQKETQRMRIESMSNTIEKNIISGKSLSAAALFPEAISAFLNTIQSACKAEHAAVYMLDPARREMVRYKSISEESVQRYVIPLVENSYIGVSAMFGVVNNVVIESKMFMNEVRYEIADVHIDGGRPWCEKWVTNPNALQWAVLHPGIDFEEGNKAFHTMLCIPLYDGDRRQPVGVLQLGDKVDLDERQFRKTFDRFDADHSGNIDFGELRLAFADLGVDAGEEDLRVMLEVLDMGEMKENDIEVTYAEFTFMLIESMEMDEDSCKRAGIDRFSRENPAPIHRNEDDEASLTEEEAMEREMVAAKGLKAKKRLEMRMKFMEKSTSTCFTKHDETVVAAAAAAGFGVIRNMMRVENSQISDRVACRMWDLAEHCGPCVVRKLDPVEKGSPSPSGDEMAAMMCEAFQVEMVSIWVFGEISSEEVGDSNFTHMLTRIGAHHETRKAAPGIGGSLPRDEEDSPGEEGAVDPNGGGVESLSTLQPLYGPHHCWDPAIGKGKTRPPNHPPVDNATKVMPRTIPVDSAHPSGLLANATLGKKLLVSKLQVDDRSGQVFDANAWYDCRVDAVPGFCASDVMCVPIVDGKVVVGAVNFLNRRPRRSFDLPSQSSARLAAMWCQMILFEKMIPFQPPTFIVLGEAASGKGRICELLVKQHGMVHVSTGAVYRYYKDAKLGRKAEAALAVNEAVPDEVVDPLIASRIKEADCVEKGWLLDGFPKTAAQASMLVEAGVHPRQCVIVEVEPSFLLEKTLPLQRGSHCTPDEIISRHEAFMEGVQGIVAEFKTEAVHVQGGAKEQAPAALAKVGAPAAVAKAAALKAKKRADRIARMKARDAEAGICRALSDAEKAAAPPVGAEWGGELLQEEGAEVEPPAAAGH